MCNIPKVKNRDRRMVSVKVDVHVEVRRVNEGVLVGRNEICKYDSPSQLRIASFSVASYPAQLVP